MATRIHLKHTKSSATTATTGGVTVPRLPSSGDLLHGEIAINYHSGYETLAIKNSEGQIVPFVTNGQTIDATKPEGLVNGQIGMDVNGEESFYIYNGVYSKWQPVSTNYLSSESELDGLPVTKDPQFAYVADTGLMYFSRYDTVSSQTWVPMAKLDVGTKALAFGEETAVVITGFDNEVAISENSLIYDSTIRKLKKYGLIPEGEFLPELVAVYSPSKNVVYYNKKTDKFFIWTGSAMKEIKKDETPIFSANTGQKTILYNLTTTANTASSSSGSIVLGHNNSVSDADMVTVVGVGNTVNSGGNYSFVEGYNNRVSGLGAHAEGSSNKAYGNYSHAEGYSTNALGELSHTEGSATTASGTRSHAEGYDNIASGENSHVGGRLSLAAGRDSFAYGHANSAYCAMSVAMGSGNIVGEPGDANSAVAASSVALGRSNSAMGYASFACGHYNYTNGMYTNAIGESTSATSLASHSEGFLSSALATASHAEGAMLPTQLGLYESDDENYDAMLEIPSPDVSGYAGNFLSTNNHLFVISSVTVSPVASDHIGYLKVKSDAEVLRRLVSGYTDYNKLPALRYDTNENGTIANGIGSHSEGFSTYSEGQASHTEGSSTSGIGDFSHAEGSNTYASGRSSHAEGHLTHANGGRSHAEGAATYANGQDSHAGGNSTSAIGDTSCAMGSRTVANNTAEFACGKYNVSTTGTGSTMFSVGIGANSNNRKNAFEVRANGKIYFYDNNGNQMCLQDVLQSLQGARS